jgi:hypothetical protein
MDVVTVLFLAFILGGAGIAWYLVHRYLRTTSKTDAGASSSELEAFIAAYRSGRIDAQAAAGAPVPAVPRAAAARAAAAPAPATAESGKPRRPGALLRPEVKLAYLSLRAGLRDHHVFPNVPIADLGHGDAPGRVDLIVSGPDFMTVAAIDVSAGAGAAANDTDKVAFLRAAGIRYLRLNARAMPKPDELKTLLYRT